MLVGKHVNLSRDEKQKKNERIFVRDFLLYSAFSPISLTFITIGKLSLKKVNMKIFADLRDFITKFVTTEINCKRRQENFS